MKVLLPPDALVDELGEVPGLAVLLLGDDGPPPDFDGEADVLVASFGIRTRVPELIDSLPNLRLVQSLHAGVDPLVPLIPDAVLLANASGVHDGPVAEWVVAVILTMRRRLLDHHAAQADHRWADTMPAVTEGRTPAVGEVADLAGARVLIVGHGAIGHAVERRLVPFGAEVTGVVRHPRDGMQGPDALADLLPAADVVVLLAPGGPDTVGLIGRSELAAMADGALLVNASRGSLVDQCALADELRVGRLRAALDVTDPEPLPADHSLWDAPNLLLTPHIAGAVPAWSARAYRFVGDQLRRLAAGEPLLNLVPTGGTSS